MKRTVIIGIDGSGPSNAALLWGTRWAAALDDPVLLVHVLDGEWGQAGPDVEVEERHEAAELLADSTRRVAKIAPSLAVEERMEEGSAAHQLAAQAGPDDLLVVGTHKTGYIRGRVLGTRSIVVATVAPCSVAVIPENWVSSRSGVLVGVASGPGWATAVKIAAAEATRRGQNLTLVHALSGGPAERDGGRALLAEAVRCALSVAPDLPVTSRVSERGASETLLDASRTAGLLVLGESRRPHSDMLGSVTHDVLLNINSPVLIAR
ncbi:MAG: universal stress protein [Salinibacterium sp.]|nr:universal stress protein [Salinibacterium sp.]